MQPPIPSANLYLVLFVCAAAIDGSESFQELASPARLVVIASSPQEAWQLAHGLLSKSYPYPAVITAVNGFDDILENLHTLSKVACGEIAPADLTGGEDYITWERF